MLKLEIEIEMYIVGKYQSSKVYATPINHTHTFYKNSFNISGIEISMEQLN